MNEPGNELTRPAADGVRKPWAKPEMTVLPVEETAIAASAGDDSNGPTTGS